MSDDWRSLLRPDLRAAQAYDVPVPPGVRVRLDANENPYPPPPEVMADLAEVVRQAPLNRYPDPASAELRAGIARRLGIPSEQIVLGNGADECIAVICACFGHAAEGRRPRAVFPTPTFVMYRYYAVAVGSEAVAVPLRPDFSLDEEALTRALSEAPTNVLFLSRPNNPTGGLWPLSATRRLAEKFPGTLVVSDEAYIDYARRPDESAVPLLDSHPNIVVLRTLSKIGLAGLRLGFAIANPDVAREINKVRGPYNIDMLSQRVAARVVDKHWDLLRGSIDRLLAERDRLAAGLAGRPGLEVFPTSANFVLGRVADGAAVWRALAERGVLVRHFGDTGPLRGCLRFTIGTPEENAELLAALDAILPR